MVDGTCPSCDRVKGGVHLHRHWTMTGVSMKNNIITIVTTININSSINIKSNLSVFKSPIFGT